MFKKRIAIPICCWYARRAARRGDLATAERLWSLAVGWGDSSVQTRRALADQLLQRGEYGLALSVLSAGTVPSNDPMFLTQLAYAHQGVGNREEAVRLWARVVALQPGAEAPYQLGVIHHQMGDYQRAAAYYQQVLAFDAKHAGAHLNQGRLFMATGQLDAARSALESAMRGMPEDPVPVCIFGETLAMEGQLDSAIVQFDKAIALDADFAAAHADKGLALHQLGRPAEAIPSLQKAIGIAPDNINAWLTLGTVLLQTGQVNAAILNLEQALQRFPNHPAVLSSLGACIAHTGDHVTGQQYLDRALAIAPDKADAHFNRALLYLKQGDYVRGFKEYEWRLEKPELKSLIADSPWPMWSGEPLNGKTILVRREQGFGDTLQFARLLPELASQGAQVHIETSPPLQRLLATVTGVGSCSASVDKARSVDFWCPVMSLPHKLGITLGNLPRSTPYFHVAPSDIERWNRHLISASGLKVGLAWASNPENWLSLVKSIPIEQLFPLVHTPNVTFVNLQVGYGTEQFKSLPTSTSTVDTAGSIQDFYDTACLVSNLDLVIAIDSAVAHLAGALGKQVWVLLHHAPDWRWETHRETSSWYPTATLFRQTSPSDWSAPVDALTVALADLAASRQR